MEHEKNEPRRRPPERNSRAAQAAQQRRDQRREQAHLEELRQKQRKRARHRTRRRINPGVWKRILIMAAVVAAVVLSMVLFFRVRSVEVTGSAYYTADEIRAACGVAQGDNLLTLSRARIAGNIMAELPYVSTVQVTRRLPDTLELTVTEYDVTYAAQGADGASYLITADGKITEKIDETAARGHIAVTACSSPARSSASSSQSPGTMTSPRRASTTRCARCCRRSRRPALRKRPHPSPCRAPMSSRSGTAISTRSSWEIPRIFPISWPILKRCSKASRITRPARSICRSAREARPDSPRSSENDTENVNYFLKSEKVY